MPRRPRAVALRLAVALTAVATPLAAALPAARAAAQSAPEIDARFQRTTARIPMRDGVRLYTDIYVPKERRGALPIILSRTPYGAAESAGRLGSSYKELADDGYIFVLQDIRGRYQSEGQFVMQRPPRDRRDPKAIDEASDAYDTIEWLVKNVTGNNGRVGMLGVSYDGWTTAMALLDPHPALKAASPQASPADMWIGDDFHHNGAFRLSYGFEYAAMMETSKENEQFEFDRADTYQWYLALGPLSTVNEKYLKRKIPTWNDFVAHPNYDAFWQRQTLVPHLRQVTVPTLNVAGWWDQEDFYGPLAIYERLEKFDREGKNFLVVGPWNHGGWNRQGGEKLGNIEFGSATAAYYRDSIQAPFFAYHLKGEGTLTQPEAITFEAGSNRWRTFDAWPPKRGATERPLYFHADGKLSFEPPRDTGAQFDAYLSDPAHPVPYRRRPIQATYDPRGSGWSTWLTEDQRFVHNRPDVLSWETEPLAEEVTIAGDVVAELFAATSGSDADWVVKLIDVYPDDHENPAMAGYQFMVSNEVLRARYRESRERPTPVRPNVVTPYRIDLHGQSYRFGKGHRIMVQVQSSWFPLIDRNPQRFVPNIFEAKASDFQPATQRVYRSARHPSAVRLPVLQEPVP
jgi:putative CocE/NonD family hydrolase